MKKLTIIFFALFMVLSLEACAGNSQFSKNNISDTVKDTDAKKQEAEEASEADDIKTEEFSDESGQQDEMTTSENAAVGTGETAGGTNILVAYFSATNTTEGVAKNLADGIGADLFEILPDEPYTDADLDYNDNNSRTTIEMNDPDARPAISDIMEDMEQYDVIFLGYPIWWGKEPMIIRTFLESYNLKGKKIVPFCTSGGSGISGSMKGVKAAAKGANVGKGKDLTDESYESVEKWVKKNIK